MRLPLGAIGSLNQTPLAGHPIPQSSNRQGGVRKSYTRESDTRKSYSTCLNMSTPSAAIFTGSRSV